MLDQMGLLWPSIIQSISFDIVNHKINAITAPSVDSTHGVHELLFEGVTAFYWVDKSSSYRKARESASHLPLDGLFYRPGKLQEILIKENDKQDRPNWDAFPNFVLEIWDTTILFIEANSVSIDGKRFEVPDPIPFTP